MNIVVLVFIFIISSIHGQLEESGRYDGPLENHKCSNGQSLSRFKYTGRRSSTCYNIKNDPTACETKCNNTPRCVAFFLSSPANNCVIVYFCDLIADTSITTTFKYIENTINMYPEATITDGVSLQSPASSTTYTPKSCVDQCVAISECKYAKFDSSSSTSFPITATSSGCETTETMTAKCTLYSFGTISISMDNYRPDESANDWASSSSSYNNFGVVYQVRDDDSPAPAPTDNSLPNPSGKPTPKSPTKPTTQTTKKPTSKPTTSKPSTPTKPTTSKPTPSTDTNNTVVIVVVVLVVLIFLFVGGYISWVKRDWIYARLATQISPEISIIPKR